MLIASPLSCCLHSPNDGAAAARSRPDTVEERDVLLRFQEARHPLVLSAMPSCHRGGGIEIAAIADLRSIGVPLQQKRLTAGTGSPQRAGQKQNENALRCHARKLRERR